MLKIHYIYNYIRGNISSLLLYPAAEVYQKRHVSPKFHELEKIYNKKYYARKNNNLESLILILEFAGKNVPYYRDLFASIKFDPQKLRNDFSHFYSIPYLTKDILLEQGNRMVRDDKNDSRIFEFKTGGSTGSSALIYYDQDALDWSSAMTLYARDYVGHKNWKSEVHFASRFPEVFPLRDRVKEYIKCFVMNRDNIFFDSLDEGELEKITEKLRYIKPDLVHAHPSTMYALALYQKNKNNKKPLCNIFESSGELLDGKKRKNIEDNLGCKVIDRYGLAEFGVVAYEINKDRKLKIFDNFVYPEARMFDLESNSPELVFTGLTNYYMPLIRYRTGDRGEIEECDDGFFIKNITGRIHDLVIINGKQYPTHYIQDVLDRIGGIKEFQVIKDKTSGMLLTLVPETNANKALIEEKINSYWQDAFTIRFIEHTELITVGWRDKFRYVVENK